MDKLQDDFNNVEITGLPNEFFLINRKNYIQNIKRMLIGVENSSLIVLAGGKEISKYDTDIVNYYFQQESNFYYLTGVREPNFYALLDVANDGALTLFYDQSKNDRDNIYSRVPKLSEISEKYNAPVFLMEDMHTTIASWLPKKIYVLNGVNSDSGRNVLTARLNFQPPLDSYNTIIDYDTLLYEILADTRTRKSSQEIQLMTKINSATVLGHIEAIKSIVPFINERDVEMKFYNFMRNNYHARIWSYPMICGHGINSATLHYDENNKELQGDELMLMDMGIRIAGYCSDITSTVPVKGTFSEDQKDIYNIVLKANQVAQSLCKPGAYWPDIHLAAERVILQGLLDKKLLTEGSKIEDMINDRVAYYFMPHGLGHFIGAEVHDVGGYLSFTPKRSDKPGLSSLRTARYLAEGNIITVEPGIYFIPYLLEKALADVNLKKYFVEKAVRDYFPFGGVRIEDNIEITADGSNNLTKDIPRTVDQIEALMKKN